MKNNQPLILCENENKKELNLSELPSILENTILNWQQANRKNNRYFNGYNELAHLLNVHPMTLRKYTNQFNPEFPKVNLLVSICNLCGDYTALEFLNDYTKGLK